MQYRRYTYNKRAQLTRVTITASWLMKQFEVSLVSTKWHPWHFLVVGFPSKQTITFKTRSMHLYCVHFRKDRACKHEHGRRHQRRSPRSSFLKVVQHGCCCCRCFVPVNGGHAVSLCMMPLNSAAGTQQQKCTYPSGMFLNATGFTLCISTSHH